MLRTLSVAISAVLSWSLTFGAAPVDKASDAFYQAIRTNDLTALDLLANQPDDVNAPDADGATPLMYAAAVGSIEAVQRLLTAGASVNARNALGSTALTWATNDIAKVKLLLDRGAEVNVVSSTGQTPLLVATMGNPSAAVVSLLIARGADARATDKLKATGLHKAALAGDVETLRILIGAGVDVNARDGADFTALMGAAANGSLEAVTLLLAHGARVNDVSGGGEVITHKHGTQQNGITALGSFTALLHAATTASPAVTRALLDAGADVNAHDVRGVTPLIAAVATDHFNIEKIRLLIARGARVNEKTVAKETALDWAQKFGRTPAVAELKKAGAVTSAGYTPPALKAAPSDLPTAVARGMAVLERTSGTQFFAKAGCAACHAQHMMDVAAGIARAKGLVLDPNEAANRLTVTRRRFAQTVTQLLERIDVAGTPDVPLFALNALAATGYTPDRTTDAMAVNVAANQYPDGRWHLGFTTRPPITDGDIARTALGIRMLKTYAPQALAAEMNARLTRATRWLEAITPTTGDDRAMRLLGLRWAGADAAVVAKAAAALTAAQRPDGGWAQRDELASDAYATGQAIYALSVAAGVPRTSAALQRGVAFLLSTQQADGSWYVRSRAVKFQPYFESGFPYGSDQWISQMATGWASAGLATVMNARPAPTAPGR
jgi:ankyrin repeat protein